MTHHQFPLGIAIALGVVVAVCLGMAAWSYLERRRR